MTVIDLTHTIKNDMPVYPGTEQPQLTTACTIEEAGYRETLLHMYSHTGTHMDAPAHMITDGQTLDDFPAEADFAGQGYGVFKPAVGEAVVELLRPLREESERIMKDKAYLESVYKEGADHASYLAQKTLSKVYRKIGFVAK